MGKNILKFKIIVWHQWCRATAEKGMAMDKPWGLDCVCLAVVMVLDKKVKCFAKKKKAKLLPLKHSKNNKNTFNCIFPFNPEFWENFKDPRMRWKKVLVGDGTLFLLEFSELITHYMVFCFFFSCQAWFERSLPPVLCDCL